MFSFFKVKYVVFREGHHKTYNLAIERKIPLVSLHWVQNCYLSNKIVNPDDYPAVDIKDYANYNKKRPEFTKLQLCLKVRFQS